MNYYVRRNSDRNAAGFAFVGPLPLGRARREAAAWEAAGDEYSPVTLMASDAHTRAFVRRWEKETRAVDAWEQVWFHDEPMTRAAYRLNHQGYTPVSER